MRRQPAQEGLSQHTGRTEFEPGPRPDGAPIHVAPDNLSAHKGTEIRRWARKNKVELCFTPTHASWANPIEARFGPLRQFTIADSDPATTPCRPGPCTTTSADATTTSATLMCLPPNAGNVPVSAARRASAGADAHSKRPGHERQG